TGGALRPGAIGSIRHWVGLDRIGGRRPGRRSHPRRVPRLDREGVSGAAVRRQRPRGRLPFRRAPGCPPVSADTATARTGLETHVVSGPETDGTEPVAVE